MNSSLNMDMKKEAGLPSTARPVEVYEWKGPCWLGREAPTNESSLVDELKHNGEKMFIDLEKY